MGRTVKLGRKMLVGPVAHHWAVKVGDTWYEVAGASKNDKGAKMRVNRNCGSQASSGAGALGGEIVGKTSKYDGQIDEWIDAWLDKYQQYDFTEENCQKFACEFVRWLTDGIFTIPHRMDSPFTSCDYDDGCVGGFATAEDGNAIARYGVGELGRLGLLSVRGASAQAQAVAGPGLGAFGDASFGRVEFSAGNIAGIHLEPNVNTGIGARNGNIEAHVLGFGGKVGADGIEINTPLGGANCNVM